MSYLKWSAAGLLVLANAAPSLACDSYADDMSLAAVLARAVKDTPVQAVSSQPRTLLPETAQPQSAAAPDARTGPRLVAARE